MIQPVRKLTASEVIFHWMHQYMHGYMTPFIRVRICGNLNVSCLQQTLFEIQNRYPLIQCCIRKIGRSYFFCQHKNDSSQIALEIKPMQNDDDWINIVYDEMNKQFDCRTGPLARFILIQSKNEIENTNIYDLLAVFHHSIVDPNDIIMLAKDWLNTYQEKEPNTRHNQPMSDFATMHHKVKSTRKRHHPQWHIYDLVLDGEQTQSLTRVCQNQNVSLFGCIAALYLSTICQFNRKSFYSIVPIALRRMVNKTYRINCLGAKVGVIRLLFSDWHRHASIWQLAKYYDITIKDELKKIKENKFFHYMTKQHQLRFVIFKLRKLKVQIFNWLFNGRFGSSIINVITKPISLPSQDLEFTKINWNGNTFFDKRNNFSICALIINEKLNITFCSAMDAADHNRIKNELADKIMLLAEPSEPLT